MKPEELHAARQALGLSLTEMGAAIGFSGSCNTLNSRVRDMESGRREVTGPVAQVVRALLAGWRPGGGDFEARAVSRMCDAINGLLVESGAAQRRAKQHAAAGQHDDAFSEAGRAEGLARGSNVMSRTLKEVVS